jgi:hypothetical protein
MKYFLCCLGLAALPAFGQSREVAPVALFTHFQQRPSQAVFDSIRQEVASIVAPLGFPFEWRSLDDAQGNEAAAELAVVTFRGNCSIANLLTATTESGPLGITHITGGVVLPFAEVDCERVHDLLRNHLIRTPAEDREMVFGRAVGRVLAHELFHIFAGTTHHGAGGLAEPAFRATELMSPRFQFNAREFRLLRVGLKSARRQNSRLRSASSPLSGRSIFGESGCASCHGTLGQGTRSAPALRATNHPVDTKTLAAKLVKDVTRMYSLAKDLRPPSLDDDEIADVVSFLNSLY